MPRNLAFCSVWLLLSAIQTPALLAQARDPRVDKLTTETAELKRTVADQDRRIADLERMVKMLQSTVAPLPAPIPSPTPAWTQASNWNRIKPGMSQAQVVEILGPPTREQSAIDMRTLYYEAGPHSTLTLTGSVSLTDDRSNGKLCSPAF